MKTLCTLLTFCMLGFGAAAANLTATVVKATSGKKNGKINLVISGGNAPFTFSWTGPSGYVASWQHPDSLAAGTYCVTVTDRYCGKATLCVSLGETPNAIAEQSLTASRIYPNPFKDHIRMQPGSRLSGAIHATLSDMSGKRIAGQTFDAAPEIDWNLPHQLPDGVYLLLLEDEQGKPERSLLIHQTE